MFSNQCLPATGRWLQADALSKRHSNQQPRTSPLQI
jgi:hypothetical protein